MKRINNLYPRLTSFENLLSASKKALKGTKSKAGSQEFFFNLENNIIKLQKELQNQTYQPGNYTYFKVYEPKEREIAVAPFIDRVVHHGVVNILEPIYEKIFIYDSYATRKDKGTHKAIFRAQSFLKKNRWYLKADIRKYFPSINQEILLLIISRKIKDKKLLKLIRLIVNNGGENGCGLPIGNLTSQFFANVYLDKFDHFIKDKLQIKYYIRYMDDFVIFSVDKEFLKELRVTVKEFLRTELKLSLKEKATFINKQANGLTFLGKRIFPAIIRIKRENLNRSIKKMKLNYKLYCKDLIEEEKLCQSAESMIGYLKTFNTYQLRKGVIH